MGDDEPASRTRGIAERFDQALDELANADAAAKPSRQGPVYELTLQLLKQPGGVRALYERAPRLDPAGVFEGGDWAVPENLQPQLAAAHLHGEPVYVALEVLSELRFLAIATGRSDHPDVTAEQARGFLEDVTAFNLNLLFPGADEASRARSAALRRGLEALFAFIVEALGTDGVLASLVDEAERLLRQRPIVTARIRRMIDTAAHSLAIDDEDPVHQRATRLVHALHGPSALSRAHPGSGDFHRALAGLDATALGAEADAFARAMHGTGLVSRQHAVLARLLEDLDDELLGRTLGLDPVGRAGLDAYRDLVRALLQVVARPATVQSLYGLACMLNRGSLFFAPVGPALWRLLGSPVHAELDRTLQTAFGGAADSPSLLVAGTISVLGQPLGVGQGDNPTCQSARAISLWAQVDPGFLLDLLVSASRDGEVDMHSEGQRLTSSQLQPGTTEALHTELDAVSLALVPHLDRVYVEMGRRIQDRGEDAHKWINPELHGWWVQRGFASAIEYGSGAVHDFAGFIRLFYVTHHPVYNGGRWLVYPQPAGIAATNIHGGFLGWHAVTIQRIAQDAGGEMRVFFYNPNNDGGQHWGQNIRTSTAGHGEVPGESSLPFEPFASRLYLFHYNVREQGDPAAVPDDAVRRVATLARQSWATGFAWHEVVRN